MFKVVRLVLKFVFDDESLIWCCGFGVVIEKDLLLYVLRFVLGDFSVWW